MHWMEELHTILNMVSSDIKVQDHNDISSRDRGMEHVADFLVAPWRSLPNLSQAEVRR